MMFSWDMIEDRVLEAQNKRSHNKVSMVPMKQNLALLLFHSTDLRPSTSWTILVSEPISSTQQMPDKRKASEMDKSSEKPTSTSPFIPMFEHFRDELDEHYDRRERIIKASRDITASSKKMCVLHGSFWCLVIGC